MDLLSIHGALLLVSFVALVGQLLVRQKRTIHLVFALFCGSIAIMAAKQIGSDRLGAYQYLVGMGVCATCNGFWLVSRALFREKNAISYRHIVAAASLGLLLIAGQALGFAQSVAVENIEAIQSTRIALYEVVNLFSSCMLVLSAWEACRGLSQAHGEQFWQRVLFLVSYCSAVLLCTVAIQLAGSAEAGASLNTMLSSVCAMQIIIVTQVLIHRRFHRNLPIAEDVAANEPDRLMVKYAPSLDNKPSSANVLSNENQGDQALAQQIHVILEQQDMYLQANLKVADLARKMDVSEYRISRVFRDHFNARNFNQFINEMRIGHAKTLLEDPANAHWPIIVVGMESGFASVGPFTRAFKSSCEMTPNQYRETHLARSKNPTPSLVG